MTFRSPPPHQRSSGGRGGKSEFEQEQRDLQRLVQQVGFDNLPVNDESLRPFLKHLWAYGAKHDHKVWSFDIPTQWPDRLFHGLRGPAVPLKKIADDLQAFLLTQYTREEIARAVPVFQVSSISTMYFEGVWTPKSALPSRRH